MNYVVMNMKKKTGRALSVNYHPVSFSGIIIVWLVLLCHSRKVCSTAGVL